MRTNILKKDTHRIINPIFEVFKLKENASPLCNFIVLKLYLVFLNWLFVMKFIGACNILNLYLIFLNFVLVAVKISSIIFLHLNNFCYFKKSFCFIFRGFVLIFKYVFVSLECFFWAIDNTNTFDICTSQVCSLRFCLTFQNKI